LQPRIGGTALAATFALFLSAPPTQAGYIVMLEQVGSDVVANGSGAIDLTGLSFLHDTGDVGFIAPDFATIFTGPGVSTVDKYYTGYTGPTSFGSGGGTTASSGSGDIVGVAIGLIDSGLVGLLAVPLDYGSGDSLSDTATYIGQTFSSLGVTPGTYEWTWGSGANQNFTLVIGEVPEPATWTMMLLGFAGLGFAGYRASRRATAIVAVR
jgi:hypothetical protein